MFSLREPSPATLERLVDRERAAGLTYEAVGLTATGGCPEGYRLDRWDVDLGEDADDRFRRCADAVLEWAPQLGAGLRVTPSGRVHQDLTFALVIPLPVGFASATARVVYVVNEPDRIGFAYGTLPAHPEEGEEAFVVGRHEGRVRFDVVAFSRPRHLLARVGSPVTRRLQLRTNHRYLDVMRRLAA